MDRPSLIQAVTRLQPAAAEQSHGDRPAVRVPIQGFLPLMQALRQEGPLAFDLLWDHTAVDWLDQGCFELLYHLYSTAHNHFLVVSVTVPRDNPVVATVSGLWRSAEWAEREVYDLFGVLYDGHPDLRRVFLDDAWRGHPLRKDYKDDGMLGLPK